MVHSRAHRAEQQLLAMSLFKSAQQGFQQASLFSGTETSDSELCTNNEGPAYGKHHECGKER